MRSNCHHNIQQLLDWFLAIDSTSYVDFFDTVPSISSIIIISIIMISISVPRQSFSDL